MDHRPVNSHEVPCINVCNKNLTVSLFATHDGFESSRPLSHTHTHIYIHTYIHTQDKTNRKKVVLLMNTDGIRLYRCCTRRILSSHTLRCGAYSPLDHTLPLPLHHWPYPKEKMYSTSASIGDYVRFGHWPRAKLVMSPVFCKKCVVGLLWLFPVECGDRTIVG